MIIIFVIVFLVQLDVSLLCANRGEARITMNIELLLFCCLAISISALNSPRTRKVSSDKTLPACQLELNLF